MDLKELAKSVLFNVKNSVKKATTNPMEQIGGITNKYPIDTNNPIYSKVAQLLPTTRALELVGIAGNKNINPTVADAYARLQNNQADQEDMMLLDKGGKDTLANLAMQASTGGAKAKQNKEYREWLMGVKREVNGLAGEQLERNLNSPTIEQLKAIARRALTNLAYDPADQAAYEQAKRLYVRDNPNVDIKQVLGNLYRMSDLPVSN